MDGWYTSNQESRPALTLLLKDPSPLLSVCLVCPVLGLIEAGADTDTVMLSGAMCLSVSPLFLFSDLITSLPVFLLPLTHHCQPEYF